MGFSMRFFHWISIEKLRHWWALDTSGAINHALKLEVGFPSFSAIFNRKMQKLPFFRAF